MQRFSSNHLHCKRYWNFASGLCHIYSFQHQFSSVTIMLQTFPSSLKMQSWCRLLLRTRKVITEFEQNAELKLRAWVCQLASFLTRCLNLMGFHLLKWLNLLKWVSLNRKAISASGGSARLVSMREACSKLSYKECSRIAAQRGKRNLKNMWSSFTPVLLHPAIF